MKRRRKAKPAAKPKRTIHRQLKKLRTDAGMSQQDFADKLGIDKTAISHWECGLSTPKNERLPEVADALGVSIDELFEDAAA